LAIWSGRWESNPLCQRVVPAQAASFRDFPHHHLPVSAQYGAVNSTLFRHYGVPGASPFGTFAVFFSTASEIELCSLKNMYSGAFSVLRSAKNELPDFKRILELPSKNSDLIFVGLSFCSISNRRIPA